MRIKQCLKERYHLSNYQIAQIAFFFKNIFSELSKIFIMGVLFHRHLKMYLFLLFLMCLLRSFSGGIHFYTYRSCLAGSVTYMWIALYALPHIALPKYIQLSLLLVCVITCYYVGPVLSKYRTNFPQKRLYYCRNVTCLIIGTYAFIMCVIPENPYIILGFWMIILHSLQLIVAKIRKKGELEKC
ncbi:MAG: accessory gene regulator B family protein [Lachnospiraceae bacterium]|nr:accessory gene regulator B family protein [Lachnospiraceae bacterium]NDO48236.1 hypothetical protein [Lachnospiraceae bacterium MD335]